MFMLAPACVYKCTRAAQMYASAHNSAAKVLLFFDICKPLCVFLYLPRLFIHSPHVFCPLLLPLRCPPLLLPLRCPPFLLSFFAFLSFSLFFALLFFSLASFFVYCARIGFGHRLSRPLPALSCVRHLPCRISVLSAAGSLSLPSLSLPMCCPNRKTATASP